MEGSTEEADLAVKGHIPQVVTTFLEVFGSDRMDHFHRIVWKEES